jgi:hypothetical protein
MFPFQFGDFAPPEIAVRKLGMRDRQIGLPHRLVAIPYDIEVERSRSPPFASRSAPIGFDAPALFQQRRRLQRGFKQNHLVQIRRLRDWSDRCRLLDARRGDQTGAGERTEPLARIRQVCRAIAQIGAEGDESAFN